MENMGVYYYNKIRINEDERVNERWLKAFIQQRWG